MSHAERLRFLYSTISKHSNYQSIHPIVSDAFPELRCDIRGKLDRQRFECAASCVRLSEATICDIGANSGYFSIAAVRAGAKLVTSYEPNSHHAEFLRISASALGLEERIVVKCELFDPNAAMKANSRYDVGLFLNVLHHLGDDFGPKRFGIEAAKREMLSLLARMAGVFDVLVFQIGFNWKGDRRYPIFERGTKSEVSEFVNAVSDSWDTQSAWSYSPEIDRYLPLEGPQMSRIDEIGEFANRPLYILKSRILPR